MKLPLFVLSIFALGLAACTIATGNSTTSVAGSITVNPSQVRQTIEGFGGATAWTSSLPAAAVIKALFDPSSGAGLTLIRNRIPFREDTSNNDSFMAKTSNYYTRNTTTYSGHSVFTLAWSNWDLTNTKNLYTQASAYSSQIRGFSTAWTPPNNSYDLWKEDDPNGTEGGKVNTVGGTTGTVTNYPSIGGILNPTHYQDYADVLADYVLGFQTNMGYPLLAVSVQNEPNYLPESYESCWWSASQFAAFLPYLQSAWTAKGASTKVILSESFTFAEDLVSPFIGSYTSLVPIVGVHQYNATGLSNPAGNYLTANFNAAWLTTSKTAGEEVWETEVSSEASSNDSSIADGLYWARMIHADMTVAEVNAFCAWWLWYNSPSALVYIPSGGSPVYNKRLYTIGQFSRFIRPGWVRLTATTNPATNVETTVYKDPNSTKFAVVLINSGSAAVTISVGSTSSFATAELYRTSATESLQDIQALTPGTSVTVPLPAQSVSTVYGTLSS